MTAAPIRLVAALADRYRIERELGQGGMATVYLAQDLKHDRRVALKVLRPELAAVLGADRFVVEIKTTAALQHPHILPLFDSGTADSFLFYVMPYIEGETLRDKLSRETQLGIDEAVRITTDVADALDYAHRHGVIHRDIKPENILLHDGRPMVADFGIALALSAAAGGRMTETGLSLGTPHYMSPEQATAEKEITTRSDVYSLGSVLYEMLTGNPPHTGASAQQIIMKIVTDTARPVTELRKSVPPNVAAAVAKALEKLPADRFASAAKFAEALANPSFAAAGTGRSQTRPFAARASASRAALLAGALIAVAATAVAVWALVRPPAAGAPWSTSVVLPDSLALDPISNNTEGLPTIALSPDGSQLVFAARRGDRTQLFVRRMSDFAVRTLEGTEGGIAPFFSTDGEAIGFFAGSALKRVSLADGQVRTLSPNMVDAWGGAWMPDGHLIVSRRRATELLVLGSNGDSLRAFRCNICSFPEPLPDGRRAIVKGRTGLHIMDLGSGADTPLLRWEARSSKDLLRGTMARLDGKGHLVYVGPGGQLFVAPFDAAKGLVTGASVSVAEGVRVESGRGAAQFTLARGGMLAWAPGAVMSEGVLVRADRTGKLDTLPSPPANYNAIDMTPDGRRLVVRVGTVTGDMALQIIDAESGKVTPWLSGPSFDGPKWAPDGRRVVFSRDGVTFVANPETSAPPRALALPAGAEEVTPMADTTSYRAWLDSEMVIVHTDRRPVERVLGQIPVGGGTPDDRWLMSEEADATASAIVARSLDGRGRRLVIAGDSRFSMVGWAAGGHEFILADAIRWRARAGPGKVLQGFYAVRYDPSNPDHPFGEPRLLFIAEVADFPGRNYAVGMGGNRFVFKQRLAAPPLREVRLLSNWHQRLEGGQ